jgi:(4-(4-[2-(gamma-L-glutamylamino)ethyl]phenoxymethyl)furan-2-yl)methanamine synthase
MNTFALDVGGANLKAADGQGFALSHEFALWRTPDRLPSALAELIAASPAADNFVATMTGELADCYETKAQGVTAIVEALAAATAGRELRIYLTDGSLVAPTVAIARPLAAAASNWHALARFSARFLPAGNGLLIDLGSTTCDIIPLVAGQPATVGHTDPDRLHASELLYTGVVRSPVCAVTPSLPWRGKQCATAHELFATTLDAYVLLGDLPEDPRSHATADGRPATRATARDRLARVICADRDMFSDDDAHAAAEAIRNAQAERIAIAVQNVVSRMNVKPRTVLISGQGEFLARRVLTQTQPQIELLSLAAELGPTVSRCAPAHALAVLAGELHAK